MYALRHNYTGNIVDSPTDIKIVDSTWVVKIKRLFRRIRRQIQSTINSKGIFPNSGIRLRCDVCAGGHFDSWRRPLSIVAVNSFVPQQLDVKSVFLYGELKETIYLHLPEGYRDGNKVAEGYIWIKTVPQRVGLSSYRTLTKIRVCPIQL
jgi:hypothetical protein